MYPIFFNYKFITIGGYGVMLGIGFYVGFMLLERDLKLSNKDPELAYKILLGAIPAGIIGAKIFHILEHLSEFGSDPMGMIFSGAGLSAYGGFVLAFIVTYVIVRINKESFLKIADMASPTMAFGYALGRMGCHVSGDGCYGIATTTFWGVAYPNGIVPINVPVYPTPLFEALFSIFIMVLLLRLRKKEFPMGSLFFIYLILNGISRFMVEFIRLNPKFYFDLTQGQLVAIPFILTGIIGLFIVNKMNMKEAKV